MYRISKNEKGFSVVEAMLILVIVALIVVVGYMFYKNYHQTIATNVATTSNSKSTTTTTPNPYAGWKTYHSILNSGLSFMYPPTWHFSPATQSPRPNNSGGVENDSVLYSAQPQVSVDKVTNQYMCVSIDEYSSTGWDSPSNWSLGKQLTSERFSIGSESVTLSTFAGDTPMQSELILHTPNNSAGNHFITTNNGFVVSVDAGFNRCQQPTGGEGITNQQADFNSQPETAIAKLIIKSLRF